MNTPNKLTVLRVLMIPIFVVFMLCEIVPGYDKWIALSIFIIASLTDFFDGYLARKHNLITNFGKFMDPLADKLLVGAAIIALITWGKIEAWIVIVIISREFIISGFRLVASDAGLVIAAGAWGKWKTVVQMIMIMVMIANFGGIFIFIEVLLKWLSLALTIISLVDYVGNNLEVITKGGM